MAGHSSPMILRMAIVPACALLAVMSFGSSYCQVVRASGPSGIADPVAISTRLLKSRQFSSGKVEEVRQARILADQSLRLQSLNPTALAVKGATLVRLEKGEGGRKLLAKSLAASRRELLAYLMNIEDRVAEDDAAGVLKNYDHALRVSTSISTILFPILTNAITDPRIQDALLPYLNRQAPWIVPFSQHVIYNSKNAQHLARIVMRTGGYGAMDPKRELSSLLVGSLINNKEYKIGKFYYLQTWPKNSSILKSVSLLQNQMPQSDDNFAWRTNQAADFGAQRGKGGQIAIFAEGGAGGVVASKLLFLGQGSYEFSALEERESVKNFVSTTWSLRCLSIEASTEIWKAGAVKSTFARRTKVSSSFELKKDCSTQELQLIVKGGDYQGLGGVIIESVHIGGNGL